MVLHPKVNDVVNKKIASGNKASPQETSTSIYFYGYQAHGNAAEAVVNYLQTLKLATPLKREKEHKRVGSIQPLDGEPVKAPCT